MSEIMSESQALPKSILSRIHESGQRIVPVVLHAARLIFCAGLLFAVIGANDQRWTLVHFTTLVPLLWAITILCLDLLGRIKWASHYRAVAVVDMLLSAAVVILFPGFSFEALAFATTATSVPFLINDQKVGIYGVGLPIAALLLRPLFGMPDWSSSLNLSALMGGLMIFALVLLALVQTVLSAQRTAIIRRPLTFQQPWERERIAGLSNHVMVPILVGLGDLYTNGRAVCILCGHNDDDLPFLISSAPMPNMDMSDVQSIHGLTQLLAADSVMFDADENIGIGCGDLERKELSKHFFGALRIVRQSIGNSSIFVPVNLGNKSGLLIYSVDTKLNEIIRQEAKILARHIYRYCEKVRVWEEKRHEMIAEARDLARRDLHDGVLQSLAALKMRLVTLTADPKFADHPGLLSLKKTTDIITIEQTRLRSLLYAAGDKNSPVNLVDILDTCLKTLALQWDSKIALRTLEPALPVDRESAENIEHLVREAIANAIRHADARDLTVTLALGREDMLISLKDNRTGSALDGKNKSDPKAILRSLSLAQRLTQVNATAYSDKVGEGTLLAIRIPMDQLSDG